MVINKNPDHLAMFIVNYVNFNFKINLVWTEKTYISFSNKFSLNSQIMLCSMFVVRSWFSPKHITDLSISKQHCTDWCNIGKYEKQDVVPEIISWRKCCQITCEIAISFYTESMISNNMNYPVNSTIFLASSEKSSRLDF